MVASHDPGQIFVMLESTAFRQMMSRFTTGITVVTVFDSVRRPVGITVNSFTSVSLTPPLILFCLDKTAQIFPVFEQATDFAVNILASDQQPISQHFADYRHHPQPSDLWSAQSPAQAPVLAHTLGWLLCRKATVYDGGDHSIILGGVTELDAATDKTDPLVYFHSQYRKLQS